jgi:protein-disulfide isomerase
MRWAGLKILRLIGRTLIAGAILAASTARADWVRLPPATPSKAAPSTDAQDAPDTLDHPTRGPETASVTIIEYSDYQCPYCRSAEAAVRRAFAAYRGRVRLVYYDFPLPSHRHAVEAAVAARCAGEQNQFWNYHDALIAEKSALDDASLRDLAATSGLDSRQFDQCLATMRYKGVVESDAEHGDAIGISGTPTFVIGRKRITGAPSDAELSGAIDAAFDAR